MTHDVAHLRRFLRPNQRKLVDAQMAALGVSEGASVALGLCRQALREWCPVEEHGKVIAALFGLENRRRTQTDEDGT